MLPVQITVRDMPNSPALEDHIRNKISKLTQYCQRINSCRVVIKVPQKHKHQGKLYSVHIDLTVPGKELAVNRKLDQDVYVAVRDAFHALQRQLECYVSKRKGEVKHHEVANHGYVKRIEDGDMYGFIQGADGNEYYFSDRNMSSVTFSQLQLGDIVQFISVPAQEGWQAHHVTLERNNIE